MQGVGSAKQAANSVGGLFDLEIDGLRPQGRVGFGCSSHNTMPDVLLNQPKTHSVEGFGYRRDLGQDVDAVFVLINHAGDSPYLAFDPLQTTQVCFFISCVAVCVLGLRFSGRQHLGSFFRCVHNANLYRVGVYGKYPLGVSHCSKRALKSSGVRYWGIRTPEQPLGRFTFRSLDRISLLEPAYVGGTLSATTSNNYFRFII